MPTTLVALALIAAFGAFAAACIWPQGDPRMLPHEHPDLPADHPHLAGSKQHTRAYIIDDLHAHWPGHEPRMEWLVAARR